MKSTTRRSAPARTPACADPDYRPPVPWLRVADDLEKKIRSTAYAPGQRLPSDAELLQQYRVSPKALADALGVLRVDGLIEWREGAGYYVCAAPEGGAT